MEKYYIEKLRRESNYIMEIQQILEWYCDNEMYRLKKMCYPMLIKIGGISDKDYDDFYSIALSVLSDTALRFDSEKEIDFDSFLASNIKRKFKTEIRDRNRAKRIPAKKLESTSNLVTEDGLELGETIPSKFDTYETACEYLFEGTKIQRYLDKLSYIQRKIVSLLSNGYKAKEIRELLHIRISVLQVCVMVIVQNLLQMEISVRDFLKGRNAILAVVISQHQSIWRLINSTWLTTKWIIL